MLRRRHTREHHRGTRNAAIEGRHRESEELRAQKPDAHQFRRDIHVAHGHEATPDAPVQDVRAIQVISTTMNRMT